MRRIFAVTATIICSQLQAQEDSSKLMDQVTITATKFSTKTTETGKVVTVISRQQIEKAGSRDLSQVITELGGVFINGYTNSPGKEKNIYLRGAKVDHTLITVDGIPVYDASGIGSNFDIRYFPIDAVERVEILKGSQSTLYGSDAIAGVINIITRKGGKKTIAPFVTAHYGSFNTLRLSAGANGKKGKVDYYATLNRFKTDGFSEAAQDSSIAEAYEKDGYEQNSLQAGLGIQASNSLRIQPYIRYSQNKGALDADQFVDEKDFSYEGKNLQTGVRNSLELGRTSLVLQYQLNHTRRSYLDDSTLSTNSYYPFSRSSYKAVEHFAEAFSVFNISNNVKITAGADFRSARYDFNNSFIDPWSSLPGKDTLSGDSTKHRQFSAYAAIHYKLKGLNLEAGFRFNDHSVYGSNLAYNFNPSYRISNALRVFANVSTGYKTPSLYQLFSEYGNKALKPETSVNWEAGAQYLPNAQSSIRASYFNRRAKDVIAFYFNPTTFESMYINQDKQNDRGFEVEANTTLLEKIQARAVYTYVTGNITTVNGGKDTSFFNLLRRPKHQLVFNLGVQVTRSLYIGSGLTYVGDRKDLYYDANFQRVDLVLPSYLLVNIYAEYALLQNKLKIFADFRNITDQKYMDVYGYNNARFNAYGGLRFQL